MSIIKSIPSRRIINGFVINTSEISIVSEFDYKTTGESFIITKGVPRCHLILDSKTTDNVTVKAMTETLISTDTGKIDEEYDEIVLESGTSLEIRFVSGHWYIFGSDGKKS